MFLELELEIERPIPEDDRDDEVEDDDRGVCVIDLGDDSVIEDVLESK